MCPRRARWAPICEWYRAGISLLRRAVLHRAQGEADLRDAVVGARSDGMTWKRIGEILGTTAQGAQQRYGKMVDDALSA